MHNFDLFYSLFHALFYVKTPTVTPHRYTVGVTAPPGHPIYNFDHAKQIYIACEKMVLQL